MSQEPQMTVLISHLIWKKKNKVTLWPDEQQTLDDYTNKLLIAFILNAENGITSAEISKHREMERIFLSIYDRLTFWEKRVAMTNVLKITGVIQEERPVW